MEKTDQDVPVETVAIPQGKSETGIWGIFQIIVDKMGEGDQIYFDITHSFRYLPLPALTVLNYTRYLKKVEVERILYGAMEALGSFNEMVQWKLEKRIEPLFDLTSLLTILDWDTAIERFLDTGNANMLKTLGSKELKPILQTSKGTKGKQLNTLLNQLERFGDQIATCRTPKLSSTITQIIQQIPQAKEELKQLRTFAPLPQRLQKRITRMKTKNRIQHGLIQRGITLLRENLINNIIREKLEKNIFTKKEYRKDAKHILHNNKDIPKDLYNLWRGIIISQNDINHAGWRENPYSYRKFKNQLKKFLNKARTIIH